MLLDEGYVASDKSSINTKTSYPASYYFSPYLKKKIGLRPKALCLKTFRLDYTWLLKSQIFGLVESYYLAPNLSLVVYSLNSLAPTVGL